MRECWNWQTGTFEGRVLHDVRVQVPSRAPSSLHFVVSYFFYALRYVFDQRNFLPFEQMMVLCCRHLSCCAAGASAV